MNKNENNGFWQLNMPAVDTHPLWVYMENAFNKEECNDIISYGYNQELAAGTVYHQKRDDNVDDVEKSIREAMVSWIFPNEGTFWIYKRLSSITNMLNNDYYKFDLAGFAEGLQFTEYTAPSGMHSAHLDKSPNGIVRKMSLVVQLSDPESYEGCNLEIIDSGGNLKLPRDQGTMLMFPSWEMHRVTPITKGKRNSLVAWITGNPFR